MGIQAYTIKSEIKITILIENDIKEQDTSKVSSQLQAPMNALPHH